MRSLSPADRRALRTKAHHLHPVVAIGQHGLTPAVLHEIDVNLLAHELIKIRVFSDVRADRDALLGRICDELDAAAVQHIGKLFVVWRPKPAETIPAKAATPRRRPRESGDVESAKSSTPRATAKTSRTRTLPMGKSAPQARRPREPNARGVARPPKAGAAKMPRSPSPRSTPGPIATPRRRRKTA